MINLKIERKTILIAILALAASIYFPEIAFSISLSTPPTDSLSIASIDTVTEPHIPFNYMNISAFCFPIHGKVISPFGYRHRRRHTGTDIKLHHGDQVRAAFTGVVTCASRYYGYGNLVVLNHGNGLSTYYAHLSKCLVHVGDSVQVGQIVGLGGRTGRATTDHLHFELRLNSKPYNAQKVFDFNNLEVLSPDLKVLMPNQYPSIAKNNKTKVETENSKTATSKKSARYYTIKSGDTLSEIAEKKHTTVKKICALNGLKKNSTLQVGKKIKIS
jgi:murein DD-endopeptidase MepM/ murein hydrolase activator NlpD